MNTGHLPTIPDLKQGFLKALIPDNKGAIPDWLQTDSAPPLGKLKDESFSGIQQRKQAMQQQLDGLAQQYAKLQAAINQQSRELMASLDAYQAQGFPEYLWNQYQQQQQKYDDANESLNRFMEGHRDFFIRYVQCCYVEYCHLSGKPLDDEQPVPGDITAQGEVQAYDANYWDTAEQLYNEGAGTWKQVYEQMESKRNVLGLDARYSSFESFTATKTKLRIRR